ncbi:MAG: hypothetical protein IJ015_00615 [Ruminococcus sp.]|nr:hypothetical protein [Ruminococcus sp.]
MTSKLSWITFVPLTLAAIAIKIIQVFFLGPDGTFYGFNSLMLSYLAIACAVLILLFSVIFCLIDRKTAPVYAINRNVFCGIFGILMAVCMACEGANRAFLLMRSMSGEVFDIIDIVFTVICAIVFVVLALNHFVGNGGVKGLSAFYLVPALWSAFRLVNCFLSFTTVSIAVTDVTILACYVFTTLFLFNYAMIVSLIKGKSPVKSAFIYGLPAVTLLLSYCVYDFLFSYMFKSASFNLFMNLPVFEMLFMALYILSFVIELSACVKSKEEIDIIEDEDVEYEDVEDPDSEIFNTLNNSITSGNKPDQAVNEALREGSDEDFLSDDDRVFIEIAQTSLNNSEQYFKDADTSEFIYGQAPSDDDFILPVDTDDTPYEVRSDESVDAYITKADSTYDADDDDSSYGRFSMDRIDKLILEISEDEVN